jgi:hypothetical protein
MEILQFKVFYFGTGRRRITDQTSSRATRRTRRQPEGAMIFPDVDFAHALRQGLVRLAHFLEAHTLDVEAVIPPDLQNHLETASRDI